jgi:4-hydroxy-3-methylbut-2-en-1-yl diphosphate reductase
VLTGYARHLERVSGDGCVPGAAHFVQSEDGGVKLGHAPDAPIAYVSQTALSVDETKSIIATLPSVANDISCKLPAEISD